MSRRRPVWHYFPLYFFIMLVCLLLVAWFFARVFEDFYREQMFVQMEETLRLLSDEAGALLAEDDFAGLEAFCQSLGERSHADYGVYSMDGALRAHSRMASARYANAPLPPRVRDALSGGASHGVGRSESLLRAAIPVHSAGRQVGVLESVRSIHALRPVIGSLYRSMVIVFIVASLVIAAAGIWTIQGIRRSLRELRRGAERFAAGDLTNRLPITGSGEVYSLALAMNHMAEQLGARIRTIQTQQNELETVFASMQDGVIALDLDGTVIDLNQAAANLLGTNAHRSRGKGMEEVLRKPNLLDFARMALASRGPVQKEIQLYDEKGENHVIAAQGTVLHGADSDEIGIVIMLHDVTHLMKLENLRRDFVANVSHELRTPITSIKGFVETLLDEGPEDPETRDRFLGIVLKHVNRLNSIIEDLLALSRIERDQGQMGMEMDEDSVRNVLAGAVELCQSKADKGEVQVLLDCPANLQAPMRSALLGQAVVNLLDNAIKYSPKGGKVWLESWEQENKIEIRVQDEGPGIENKHLSRLFERFYRVDRARSRELGGTGLGLAIVKHIMVLHGGTVGVKSQLGSGTTFFLRFPAHR